jgi:hypothetical protein
MGLEKRTIPCVCRHCGVEFLARKSAVKSGGGIFCGRACTVLARTTGTPDSKREAHRLASIRYRERHAARLTDKRRLYESTPEVRDRYRAAKNAREKVRIAILRGRMVRPSQCEECGTVAYVEGAHEDYARPFDVRWLCRRCHRRWDAAVPKTLERVSSHAPAS